MNIDDIKIVNTVRRRPCLLAVECKWLIYNNLAKMPYRYFGRAFCAFR